MIRHGRTGSRLARLARLVASVALIALLAESAVGARLPGTALAMRTPKALAFAATAKHGSGSLAITAGGTGRTTVGKPLGAARQRGSIAGRHTAWATLPVGLQTELTRLGLGPTVHRVRPSRGARWAMLGQRPRPLAARPSCQCGDGGGPTWSQQAELTAADGTANYWFGDAVVLSSDGSTAVVGAPFANNSAGAVYIFYLINGTWTEIGKLTASDGVGGDDFGKTVALGSDDTLLIGANNKNDGRGVAYIFVPAPYFGWMQQAELNDPSGGIDDSFGSSVALSSNGSTALISAPGVNTEGAAYVFTRSGSTWSQSAALTAANAAPYIDDFGISLALSGDGSTTLIGDPNGNNGTGAAYIFAQSGGAWTQQAELIASDAVFGDNFGGSVALGSNGSAGPVALIGAPNKNHYTGAAYVFVPFFGWAQEAELTASDGVMFDDFGTSVALNTNGSASAVALIGAYYKNTDTGAAYVFEDKGSYGPWAQAQELAAADGGIGDSFGQSVALSGDGSTALIGANSWNNFTGAAYIFSTSPTPPPTNTPTSTPTNTPVPPTNTPTSTPVPPTSTPTNTPIPPTNTPVPPTNTPTSTPTPVASLMSSAASGSPYQTITLTGTGFAPVETVKLFWDSTTSPLTTATTLATGSFVAHLTVPQAVAGAHTLKAVGQSSSRAASTPFQVKPAVVLSPTHGKAGSSATMTGVGFGGGETVAALWYPGLKPLKSGPANALGTVALSITVPLSSTGSYAVVGYGLTTKLYAAAPFQVTP